VLYRTSDGQWKLADFGISAEASSKLATTTKARGTYEYKAPELNLHRPQFSNKSDIWALGCILHELATGADHTCFVPDRNTLFKGVGAVDGPDLSISIPWLPFPWFLGEHVIGLIRDLLANDSAHRPSAKVVHRSLISYCQLSELPNLGILLQTAAYPSYSEWKELQLRNMESPEPSNGVISLPLKLMIENSAGRTPVQLGDLISIHTAAQDGDLDVLKRCKDAGADMSARDLLRRTPLYYAVVSGRVDVLNVLCEMGGDISTIYLHGRTLMHLAALGNSVGAIETLQRLGGDISATDHDERTPMHLAALENSVGAIETLQRLGGDISATGLDGHTPIHVAAMRNSVDAIEALQRLGGDISATGNDGDTPMHGAAMLGQIAAVEMLRKLGGDMDAKNDAGLTPMQLAKSKGLDAVVEAMKKMKRDVSNYSRAEVGDWWSTVLIK
jgi:ankyrin repeat protein